MGTTELAVDRKPPTKAVRYELAPSRFQTRVAELSVDGMFDGYTKTDRTAASMEDFEQAVYDEVVYPTRHQETLATAVVWNPESGEIWREGPEPPDEARALALLSGGYLRFTVIKLPGYTSAPPEGIYHSKDSVLYSNGIECARMSTTSNVEDLGRLEIDRVSEPFPTENPDFNEPYWKDVSERIRDAVWESAAGNPPDELAFRVPNSDRKLNLERFGTFGNLADGQFASFAATSRRLAERTAAAVGHEARVYETVSGDQKRYSVLIPRAAIL